MCVLEVKHKTKHNSGASVCLRIYTHFIVFQDIKSRFCPIDMSALLAVVEVHD